MNARYRYRIYPTPGPQIALAKLFGCTRVVWNDALAHCIEQYRAGNKKPSNGQLQKHFITRAKQTSERQWLSEVSNIPLQQSLNDLNLAYQNFFKSCQGERKGRPVRPPKFKKRRAKPSARFTRGGFSFKGNQVYLAKIGNLKVIWSRPLPADPSSVTVIKDAAGRDFLSFVVEIVPESLPKTENSVGIDLGISTFATLSKHDGIEETREKIPAPKPLKKRIKRLRKLNRNWSRKQKGSKRYERARRRQAKLYAQMKDTRTDFLHKLSTRMVRENQAINLEDLNVAGMMKNRCLSRAISDLGWRQFRTLVEGKCEKYGRDFRVIDRWEPSTQRCSKCKFVGGKLDLSVRIWKCINCHEIHDRDDNGATNIRVAGGQSETLNGRGGGRKTSAKEAASDEASTRPKFEQLSLFEAV